MAGRFPGRRRGAVRTEELPVHTASAGSGGTSKIQERRRSWGKAEAGLTQKLMRAGRKWRVKEMAQGRIKEGCWGSLKHGGRNEGCGKDAGRNKKMKLGDRHDVGWH